MNDYYTWKSAKCQGLVKNEFTFFYLRILELPRSVQRAHRSQNLLKFEVLKIADVLHIFRPE